MEKAAIIGGGMTAFGAGATYYGGRQLKGVVMEMRGIKTLEEAKVLSERLLNTDRTWNPIKRTENVLGLVDDASDLARAVAGDSLGLLARTPKIIRGGAAVAAGVPTAFLGAGLLLGAALFEE